MIDVKQAIAAAKQHAETLFEGENLGAPTLEEVWFDDQAREWCITVGLRSGPLGVIAGKQFGRLPHDDLIYKTVRIDGRTGEPKSVKIRDVAN